MVRHQRNEVDALANMLYGKNVTDEQRRQLKSIIGRSNPVPQAACQIAGLYGIDGVSFLERLVYPLDLAPEGRALILMVATNTDNQIGSFLSVLEYTERLRCGESPANISKCIQRSRHTIA